MLKVNATEGDADVTDPEEYANLRREYWGAEDEEDAVKDSSEDEDMLATLFKTKSQDLKGYIEEESNAEKPLLIKPVKFPLLIRIILKINVVYELMTCFALFASIFFSTYSAVFQFYNKDISRTELILEYAFSVDILIRLSVEAWRCVTGCRYKIFLVNYTFFLALMDIISLLPLDMLITFSTDLNSLKAIERLDTIGMLRILRLFRMNRFFAKLKEDMRSNQKAISVIRYMFVYFLVLHFFACFMFLICGKPYLEWLLHRVQDVDSNSTFSCYLRMRKTKAEVPKNYLQSYPESSFLYFFTLEFVGSILSTVGYGNIIPLNNLERLLAVIIMFVGSIWIQGDLTSTLTDYILDHDAALYSLFFRRDGISDHIADHHGSSFIDTKIRAYYLYLWSYREGLHEIELTGIPAGMQADIMFDLCEEMFNKSPLFRGIDETFLHSLAHTAEVRLLNPDIQVIEQDSLCQEMYYVLQGELGVLNNVDDNHTSLIYRAGCSVGEINLFYALPYENTVYTRTVCQLLVITKEHLMTHLQYNPHIYSIMRLRIANRRRDLRNGNTLVHYHSLIKMIYRRTEEEMIGVAKDIHLKDYPVVVRKSTGCNSIVTGDILQDRDETYIIEMPCTNKAIRTIYATSYREVLIPNILSSDALFLRCWNAISLAFWVILLITTPFCAVFDNYKNAENTICSIMGSRFYIMIFINAVDLLVEIMAACPTTGIRFKVLDGWNMKKGTTGFYFDLVTLIPVELVYAHHVVPMIRSVLKCWKIFRVFSVLDIFFPLNLFLVRLCKILAIFIYIVYCTTMFLLWMVCPSQNIEECRPISYFDSRYPLTRLERLRMEVPEQHIFVSTATFAVSSLTSLGFGDISPTTTIEMVYSTFIMAIGAFMVAYCQSELTSALAAQFRLAVIFNQKLEAVAEFMSNQGLTELLTGRVTEHYRLSHELVKKCLLPSGKNHIMFDAPKDILQDMLVIESEIYLDGVPIFSKVEHDTIIKIARAMKRWLVPPGITFVKQGEVRRQIYIVVHGWVGLYKEDASEPEAIYRSTAHFGLRDLLFGEPYQCKVKTLSNVMLYAIDYSIFETIFKADEEFLRFVAKHKAEMDAGVSELLAKHYNEEIRTDEGPPFLPSWIRYSSHPDEPIIQGVTDFEDFERPYLNCENSDWFRESLLPRTIQPYGAFAKVYTVIVGILALLNTALLFIETYMGYRTPMFRLYQFLVDVFFFCDVFVRCHHGYEKYGQVYYHPLKTCLNYAFKGPFFVDLCLTVPVELFIFFIGATDILGYGEGFAWYTKLRWARVLRIYKFSELVVLVHKTFKHRSALFFMLFLMSAVMLSTFLGAVACSLSCPTYGHEWHEGDQFKLPACKKSSWIRIKASEVRTLIRRFGPSQKGIDRALEPSSFWTRWILMVYYVGQVIMVIGFGDMIVLKKEEMRFLLVIAIFGFLAMQCMTSDMTAAQVDSDEIRARSREQLNRIAIVLSREGAPAKFIRDVKAHFNLNWCYTKGMHPKEILGELHPLLEFDVFRDYVGDIFERVPIFRGFSRSVIYAMCKLMRKEYFARGELITRYGNMEFEIFVIAGGKVYMTDSQDRWITTLSIGESFGEMSLVYSTKRLYSAYAATTVEVFALTAVDLAVLLDRFPSVKESIVGSLRRNKRDSFLIKAWKLRNIDPNSYEHEQKDKTRELERFTRPHDLIVKIEGNVKLRHEEKYHTEKRSIFGWGAEDIVDHYFIYFASERYNEFRFIIHPGCKLINYMQTLGTIVRYALPCMALYNVFFYIEDPKDTETTVYAQLVVHTLEFIYYLHMLLQFFTAWEIDKRKCYCKISSKLIINYLFTPALFPLDLLAVFPYQLLTGNHGTKFMLFRCLLLIEYFNKLLGKKDDLKVSTFQYKLSISFSVFGLMAHLFACVLFWVACQETKLSSCRVDSWVTRVKEDYKRLGMHNNNERPSYWYGISLYGVITTLTTTGFGDISPTNIYEIILFTLGVFLGAFSLSIMLGNITTGLASLNKAKREFFYHWKTVINYLRSIGLSERAQHLLATYVSMQWANCRGVNYNESIEPLPSCLRTEAYVALFHKCVTHCSFFGNEYDISFVRNVCTRMQHIMFLPGMKIANELEPSVGLYIVLRGSASSYQLDPSTGQHVFRKRYDQFTAFGKIPALFPDTLHNKSYRAEGKCEVILITHEDIRRILRNYPRWRAYLRAIAKERYGEFATVAGLRSVVKRTKGETLTKRIIAQDFKIAEEILTGHYEYENEDAT